MLVLSVQLPQAITRRATRSISKIPKMVPYLGGIKSCDVGQSFMVCVSNTGLVMTAGDGFYGKLGHGDMDNQPTLRTVRYLLEGVAQCSAGDRHTVCVLTNGK